MLYPFELRALSDKPSAPNWNSVEASTRQNAFRPLRLIFPHGGRTSRAGSAVGFYGCDDRLRVTANRQKGIMELATAGGSASRGFRDVRDWPTHRGRLLRRGSESGDTLRREPLPRGDHISYTKRAARVSIYVGCRLRDRTEYRSS
jgi:hypothetical protein